MERKSRYEFYLNEENRVLNLEQRNAKVPEAIVKKQFEVGMVLVGLSLIHDNKQAGEPGISVEHEDGGWDFDEVVRMVSRAMAPVIVPMIQGLGDWGQEELEGGDLVGQAS